MPDSQQNSVTAQLEYQKLMVSLPPLLRSLLLSLLPSSSLRALALSRNRCATAPTSQTNLRKPFHRHHSAGIRCPHWLRQKRFKGKMGVNVKGRRKTISRLRPRKDASRIRRLRIQTRRSAQHLPTSSSKMTYARSCGSNIPTSARQRSWPGSRSGGQK
jgi:hypothetical protein